MKTIILIRHAKSSWEHNVDDHNRPLNKRGFKDAEIVSNHFKEKGLDVDRVISSDANRAKTTAETFISNLNIAEGKVHFNHKLYDFSGSKLIEVIKNCENSVDHLMIFGHNHAITAFVNTFGDKYIDNVPTCGVVIIEFNIENWESLEPGKTIKMVFPRDLK